MKFKVDIIRTSFEYSSVEVEAESQDDAEGLVEDDVDAYVPLPFVIKTNRGHWEVDPS